MAPTAGFSNVLNKTTESFEPHEFDAWEDEFQAIYKEKKQVDLVLQEVTQKKSFYRGEGKKSQKDEKVRDFYSKATYKNNVKFAFENPSLKEETYSYFSRVPYSMTSPYSNLNLYEDKSNVLEGSQCFRAKHSSKTSHLMVFAKNNLELTKQDIEQDYLLVHPTFNNIIGNKKYFCYGVPVEMPRIGHCKNCNQFFFTQVFCYKANDPVYGKRKMYTQFINNPYCNVSKKDRFHNGVSDVSDLVPCVCYDEINPFVIDPGNLDSK